MSSISGISSFQFQQTPPPRQTATQVTNDFFAKVDPKGSGSFDKSTLSQVADKVSISQGSVDAMFSLMDSNGDGSVTKQEFTNLLQTIAPQSESQSNQSKNSPASNGVGSVHGHAGGPPPPPPSNTGSGSNVSTISTDPADTNGDGIVSVEEAMVYSQTTSVKTGTLSGSDVMTAQAINMISSYAASEKNQVSSTSSWIA